MQNQEHVNGLPDPTPPLEQSYLNTDPREQPYNQPSQQQYEYPAYADGYVDSDMGNIWSKESEKIQPKTQQQQGIWLLLSMLPLLAILIVAGILFHILISWLSWAALIVLIIIAIVLVSSNWRVTSIPIPAQSFEVSERPMLTIRNFSGRVTLHRGDPGVVSITGYKRSSGIGINPESMHIETNKLGNTLNVTSHATWNLLQFGMRNIDMDITIPPTSDIELVNGSGSINVQGSQGTFKLRTGSGSISLQDLQGKIAARSGSGSVEMSNLQGQIDLHTGSGHIEFDNLQGRIKLRTGSARIEGRNVTGQISAQTGSGHIELLHSALAGDSDLKTGSSRITFEGSLDPHGQYHLVTGSGSINVTLPANAAFSLKASTGSGGVVNEFGDKEIGTFPHPPLRLSTGSGGIRIYKL